MEKPSVSIIIPVYNVSQYLKKCVCSLVAQDFRETEIILVDDESSDGSGILADQLALIDDRIKVIHQDNKGVSEARNAGLRIAKGDYVTFVDGDDWVDEDYISYLLQVAKGQHCEMGINLSFHRVNKNQNKDINTEYSASAEECILGIYSGKIDVAVWNKIYKRELLERNNIIFNPEIWYGEGMLFNIEVLQLVDYVGVGDKRVYHQTYNPESAMRKFNLESNLCGVRSLEIQRSKWKKQSKEIQLQWMYHKYKFYQSILNGIVRSDMEDRYPKVLKNCIKGLRREIKIPLKCEQSMISKINWICYYLAPLTMAKRAASKHYRYAKKYGLDAD